MTDAPTQFPTISLRGATVPIHLAVVQLVAGEDSLPRYEFVTNEEGNVVVEEVGLFMDVNVLSELEEKYGSLDAWQGAMTSKPFTAMRATIAVMLGRTIEQVGKGMLPSETKNYGAAVGAAFAIANGVDPTQAMKIVEQASKINMNDAVDELLAAANKVEPKDSDSPSVSGSAPGPAGDATTESSGA